MVVVDLKSDAQRPVLHILEESQPLNYTENRWRLVNRSHVWRPPTDVFETEEAYLVRVEIAGMQDEDFSISLSNRYLVIRGVRPDITGRKAYHQMEIFFGEFFSEVELPGPVSAEKTEAEYQAGFLWVSLPKVVPQKIQVTE